MHSGEGLGFSESVFGWGSTLSRFDKENTGCHGLPIEEPLCVAGLDEDGAHVVVRAVLSAARGPEPAGGKIWRTEETWLRPCDP